MDALPVDETAAGDPAAAWLRQLVQATNDHDLDALVDCFAADYVNQTPAHPARNFIGRQQVRANWTQIFRAVPDLRATVLRSAVLRSAVDGDTVFSEWEMSGTRRDGSPHLMRGVIVFGVLQGRAGWARFYLEPVQEEGAGVDAAVRSQVGLAT